jgi:hypothetical protein
VPDTVTIDKNFARKLAGTVRLLASNRPNEAAAAAQAFARILLGAGNDVIFGVAERIENESNGKLSDTEMKEIFDAGVEHGKKLGAQAQQAQAQQAQAQFPSGRAMAVYCFERMDRLHKDKDRDFVNHMMQWTRSRPLKPRQQTWLEDIYVRLGGSI